SRERGRPPRIEELLTELMRPNQSKAANNKFLLVYIKRRSRCPSVHPYARLTRKRHHFNLCFIETIVPLIGKIERIHRMHDYSVCILKDAQVAGISPDDIRCIRGVKPFSNRRIAVRSVELFGPDVR